MDANTEENLVNTERQSETPSSLSESQSVLPGWTKEEKFSLLVSIKKYNSDNIQAIMQDIPSKSQQEIKSAIEYYRNKALKNRLQSAPKPSKAKKKPDKSPRIPLAQWAKLLTDNLSFSDLQTEIKDAVRMIAYFEEFPKAVETEQIDFQKIYHLIADAMEGKPLPDNKLITEVLNNCLMDTVLVSKSFMKPTAFKLVMSSINLDNKYHFAGFSRSTDQWDLSFLRELNYQTNYNPLNIPEDYQQPSSHVVFND